MQERPSVEVFRTCEHDVGVIFLASKQEVFRLEVAVSNLSRVQVRQHLEQRDDQVAGFGFGVGGFVANAVEQLAASHLFAMEMTKKMKTCTKAITLKNQRAYQDRPR